MTKKLIILIIAIIMMQQNSYLAQDFLFEENAQLKVNTEPLIGVLTQPSGYRSHPKDQYSYLASAYVKLIEEAGGQVVPVQYDLPRKDIKKILEGLNGFLLPGGNADLWDNEQTRDKLSQHAKTAKNIISMAIDINKKGDYFPVWGTCLGYEQILLSLSKDTNILENFDSHDHSEPIEVKDQASKLYGSMPKNVLDNLQKEKLLYFNHGFGLSAKKFNTNKFLTENFKITSLGKTQGGEEFIGSIEGKKYPLFGSQYHTEKMAYIFKDKLNINHSQNAIDVGHYVAKFIVGEARKNNRKYQDKEVRENKMIYNYNPDKVQNYFMQVYFFKNIESKNKNLI